MLYCFLCFFFFFSSRRRHTRCSRDWSSDVCSSDLIVFYGTMEGWLKAVDATTGTLLWKFKTPSGIIGNPMRSEEHTSELQSRLHLVCRLLLEKKKKT